MSDPSILTIHARDLARKRELLAQNITNDLFLCDKEDQPGQVGKRAHLIGEDGANLGDWTHASVKARVLKKLTKYNVFE